MNEIVWILVAFVCGSLPLSVWLGRYVLRADITRLGDKNPGAANVARAGGMGWGMLAVLLDYSKGLIPVGLAHLAFGFDGIALVAVALAPIAGHAFSPILGFRGGKAIAVTFGVWTGLTLWLVPMILGIFLGIYLVLIKPDGWAVALGALSLLIVLLFIGNPVWLAVWTGMALIMGWKQRHDLSQRPSLKIGQGRG